MPKMPKLRVNAQSEKVGKKDYRGWDADERK